MQKTLTAIAGLALSASSAAAQPPVLTVLTYDSFTSDWGPGPAIEKAFEAECSCDLRFEAAGDGAALLSRVQLEGDASDADIVLGLDQNLISRARATGLFAPHSVEAALDLPIAWSDDTFLPFDWGYFAFVSTGDVAAPSNFKELAESDLKIVIQDPRSSTPGLGLLMWTKAVYGDDSPQIWETLADNVLTVTPGWSEAYNLFLEGEADAVLSYTTSPAYHLIAESDDSKVAWQFDEGHYLQVEVVAKLAATDQPELADQFMQFVTSEGFQSVIPTTNWMYPAVTPEAGLPEGFGTPPAIALLLSAENAAAMRDAALDEWRTALSR